MAESVTNKLVKFAFGKKASYSAASHSDYVYFATDYPYVHANGMWRGVSGASLSGNTLKITTAEKDSDNSNTVNTTVSVDLSSIATTSTQRANWDTAYNFVKSITEDDTDGVINKWQEIVDFLAGIDGTTLQGIVDTKADKATKVFGLTGNGGLGGIKVQIVKENGNTPTAGQATLGTHFRIAINNQMTTGTYTKLTVDEFGMVTAGTTLAASDIPTLEISKINNLQTTLNGLSLNTHTHSVKINGATKTIAASGGTAVDLGSYLPLTGGTVSGNITATKFIGALQGNADTATKLSAKRKIFGTDFDGSADVYSSTLSLLGTAPTTATAYTIETIKGGVNAGKIQWGTDGKLNLLISDGTTWGDDKFGVSIEATDLKFNNKSVFYDGSTAFNNVMKGYVPTTRTITAGNGLTGGGNLTADRTLTVKAADASINVSASGIKVVSAPKLTTARNLWGNSFDGSADVSGNIIHNSTDDLYYWGLFDTKNTTKEKGFIGFYHNVNEMNFPNGIKLAYNTSSGTTDGVVFMNDNLFTYNGKPIFYQGSADFNSAITEILGPMADDFTKLSNRVTAVETQLKWIEVS